MATRRRDERQLRDPRELSAVAHPVRLGILEELSLNGPLTATELGERLGETPANCSWHLRKLAEHDFVEEAPSEGGRRRPWQVTGVGLSWGEGEISPDERRARARSDAASSPGQVGAWSRAYAAAGCSGAPEVNVSHCLAASTAPTRCAGPLAQPTFQPVSE